MNDVELEKEIRVLKRKLALAETNLARARQVKIAQERVDSVFSNSLDKEHQFFNLVLENITNTLLLFDFDGRFAYASRTFLQDAGIANFGLINGRHYSEVLQPLLTEEAHSKFIEALNTAINQKKTIAIEDRIDLGQKGILRDFSVFITPMFDRYSDNNVLLGIMALINDITEIKTTMENIRKAEIAEESNKAKSLFLARMSHEIRTPMNAILGISEIQMQNKSNTSIIEEAFSKIYNSANTLLRIINDILDLSKIEAGKLELVIDQYDIANMLYDTAELNIMRIDDKPIEFRLEVNENTPSALWGDELRIRQILNNLLSNAFKYTEQGEVELEVSAEYVSGKEESDVMLIFRVHDTGQGMSPEQVRELFDEYTRFNTDANRTIEGAGLGMNITQHLIKLMKGKISVESTPGKGSTFTVQLPQKNTGSDILGKKNSENLRHFRIHQATKLKKVHIMHKQMSRASVLVVDDVETNLYVAKGMMSPYGLSVDIVSSGYEAIDRLSNGYIYDIIFMDHMMPRMDGVETVELIREIKSADSYFKNVPIIALTANAVIGSREMFIENGFNDFLSKPINIIELNAILEKWIPAEKQDAASSDMRSYSEFPNMIMDIEIAGVDVSKGIAISCGTIDNYLWTISVFHKESRKKINEIKVCLEEANLPLYITYVHALKSACANIGAIKLSDTAEALEAAGQRKDMDFIRTYNNKFLTDLEILLDSIDKVISAQSVENQACSADTELIKNELFRLKTAMDEYDIAVINETAKNLKVFLHAPNIGDILGQILQHKLHSEYDKAILLIDKILSDIH